MHKCLFLLEVCKYVQKKLNKSKRTKNYKQKFYKNKHHIFNTKNNSLFKRFAFNNNNSNSEESVKKELATLFKKNISKILNNK